jgi:uncharacterized protein YqjF (DUF2071 family)
VAGARALTGLPYHNAEMTATADGVIDYSCRREGTDQAARYRYRPGGMPRATEAESLEFFLLERYYLYSQRDGSLVRSQVSHCPYRFRDAEIQNSSALPLHLDGFPAIPDEAAHVCFVDGFDVEVHATQSLG